MGYINIVFEHLKILSNTTMFVREPIREDEKTKRNRPNRTFEESTMGVGQTKIGLKLKFVRLNTLVS